MGQRGNSAALVCLLGLGSVLAPQAHAVPGAAEDRARQRAYEEFRRRFDAGDYAGALRPAEEIVRLSKGRGQDPAGLPPALNNLGVVQLRAGAPVEAERSFAAAIEVLERTAGVISPRKLPALAGLGAAQSAQGRHAAAAATLDQALALSRRSSGLFNPGQLSTLEALASNLEKLGDVAGVDRHRQFAVEVAQRTYGQDDPRVLPWLESLAAWYERTDRLAPALDVHRRRVEIAAAEGGGRNEATIRALLDLARAHRIQYLSDPAAALAGTAGVPDGHYTDPSTWRTRRNADPLAMPRHTRLTRPNQEGLRAIQRAVDVLESVGSPPERLLADALLAMGDWYLVEGAGNRAMEAYGRAWPLLEASRRPGEPNPLGSPRPVAYQPSARAGASRHPVPGFVERQGAFRLAIGPDGTVASADYAGGDLPGAQGAQLRRSLLRATFSPRFEAGRPVPAPDHEHRESWWCPPQEEARLAAAEAGVQAHRPDAGPED